uniref:Uncharacterized protein n=5 Tax=Cellia TaxID=44534 RepID=A0A182HYX9_ANOAR
MQGLEIGGGGGSSNGGATGNGGMGGQQQQSGGGPGSVVMGGGGASGMSSSGQPTSPYGMDMDVGEMEASELTFDHLDVMPSPPQDNNQVAAWYDTDL